MFYIALMVLLLSCQQDKASPSDTEDTGGLSTDDTGAIVGDTADEQVIWPGGYLIVRVTTDPDDELAEEYYDSIDGAIHLNVVYSQAQPEGCDWSSWVGVATVLAGANWAGYFRVPVGWACADGYFYRTDPVEGSASYIGTEYSGHTEPVFVDLDEEETVTLTLACSQYDAGQPD